MRMRLILPQTLPNTPPNPPLKLLRILSPQPCRLDISRTLVVRARQHGNHGDQNRLGRLHGRPPLRRGFVPVFVFFGGVEDGDAHFAVGVDYALIVSTSTVAWFVDTLGEERTIRMKDRRFKFHLRRHMRVLNRKGKAGLEEASYTSYVHSQ